MPRSSTAPPPTDPADPPPAEADEAPAASGVESEDAPPDPTPEAAGTKDRDDSEPDEGGIFEYIVEYPSTSHRQGFPPQTADLGDICELGYTPTDGRWKPSPGPVTRWPDPEYGPGGSQHPAHDPTLVAHSLAEHQEILDRLGVAPKGSEQ